MSYTPDPATVQQVPMDAAMRWEFCCWLYKNWSQAVDDLKRAKTTEWDKKIYGDKLSWQHSVACMTEEATKRRDKWDDLLKYYQQYQPKLQQGE